jgi:hypothetical protein
MLDTPKFLRIGDIATIHRTKRDAWTTSDSEDGGNLEDIESEDLKAFADAVRRKEQWYFKIIDQDDLAKKWTKEARLPEHPHVNALIRWALGVVLVFAMLTIILQPASSRTKLNVYA